MMDLKIREFGLLITVKLYTVILWWQTRLQLVQPFLHHTERKQISPKDSCIKYCQVFRPHTWNLITPGFSQEQWVTKNIWLHLNLPSLQNIWFSYKDFTVMSNYVKCLEYRESIYYLLATSLLLCFSASGQKEKIPPKSLLYLLFTKFSIDNSICLMLF